MFQRIVCICCLSAVAFPAPSGARETLLKSDSTEGAPSAPRLEWRTDYADAMAEAKQQKKMLLLVFHETGKESSVERFERQSLSDPRVREKLANYVPCMLPLDVGIRVSGKPVKVMQHGAFTELEQRPGVAIVDFANPGTDHYGYVVSVLPFGSGKYYRFKPQHVAVLLNLPSGSLTQRTLMFAVRIHPEAPASTKGELDTTLMREARSHSHYQARIRNQGHHNWGSRFHRISRLLPFGLRAQEVVAESWPGEGLVDAAVDCVDSWRHSSGHWSAVRSRQQRFGYDIQRGSNGIWYATGVFGN